LLQRRQEIESEIIHQSPDSDGQPRGNQTSDVTAQKAERIVLRQEQNERKIKAIEQAWHSFSEPYQRDFIKFNFVENIRMDDINLPFSDRTMKRIRKTFLICLAENLHEI
jgi:hypothetical protein